MIFGPPEVSEYYLVVLGLEAYGLSIQCARTDLLPERTWVNIFGLLTLGSHQEPHLKHSHVPDVYRRFSENKQKLTFWFWLSLI